MSKSHPCSRYSRQKPRGRAYLLIFMLSLGIVSAALMACMSNPAAPPAPLVEIPSALRIPASLTIDVDSLGPDNSDPSLGSFKSQVAPGGEFSDAISLGFTLTSQPVSPLAGGIIDPSAVNGFSLLEGFVLNLFSSFEIPISPTKFTFRALTPTPTQEKPTLLAGGENIKIDFADFDFDGDGETEGCTGCTCPAGCAPTLSACPGEIPEDQLRPICLRVWITGLRSSDGTENPGFQRFMALVFDRLPSLDDPENIGIGRLRSSAITDPVGAPSSFGANFSHAVASARSSEVFVFSPNFTGAVGDFFDVHTRQTQEGESASALKTTLATVGQTLESQGSSEQLSGYIGRFLQDRNFWGGSVNRVDIFPNDGVDTAIDITDVCAQLSTGEGAPPPICLDLGINVTDETFPDRATPSDGSLPEDFPLLPTF